MSHRRARRSHAALLVTMAVISSATLIVSSGAGLAQSAVAQARRFELRIENGRIAANVKGIQVQRDEFVQIIWSADRRTTVHLHGYDLEITIDPGDAPIMAFQARATGRFPIEAHGGRHAVLLYLEVLPR